MSSFIASTSQIPAHAPFGAAWDPEYNQHVVKISEITSLFLSTPDARALYFSLGTSLAARGVVAMPADLAARLEVLARSLRWEHQDGCAADVEAILADIGGAPTAVDAEAEAEFSFDHALADCLYPAGCTGCVDADPEHSCSADCTYGTCGVTRAREVGYSGRGENGGPHCDVCADFGHVAAHPDLGCGDVGCDSAHGEAAEMDGADR